MKNEEGITLASLVIYIVVAIIAVGMLATLMIYFTSNVADYGRDKLKAEGLDQFYSYFIQEVKKTGNGVSEISTPDGDSITFTSGTKFLFEEPDIYLIVNNDDKIKLATKIENCKFIQPDPTNTPNILKTEITIDSEIYTQEFILSNKLEVASEVEETSYKVIPSLTRNGDEINYYDGTIHQYTIGDEVNYTPDTTTTSVVSPTAQNGDSDQTINQENLTWVILALDKENPENVLLTTEVPTTGKLTLNGATAYNDGPEELNRICEALYSKGNIKARSINVEDVNNCLEFEPTRGIYKDTDDIYKPLPVGINTLYDLATKSIPMITYENEQMTLWRRIAQDKALRPNYFKTPDGKQNVDSTGNLVADNTLANYPLDMMYYKVINNVNNMQVQDVCKDGNSGIMTAKGKKLIFGYALDHGNWQPYYYVLSGGVQLYGEAGWAAFGIGFVGAGLLRCGWEQCNSVDGKHSAAWFFRPVVSIPAADILTN